MSVPIRFGLINTMGQPPQWAVPWKDRYDAVLEQIAWIDRDLDIDGVYLTEHHFYGDGYIPSPMVMAAAIAARTSRVTIGTNLVQLPLWNAVRLAEDSLVVDALSGGRFRLGVGLGYYHQEFDGLGRSLRHRASLAEESMDILRLAFAGEPFEYHGRHYDFGRIQITPGPVRPGGPEIWMGAFAPKAVERAARLADGFLEFDPGTLGSYFAACESLRKPRSQQRGNVTYWAIIAEDPERAFALAGEHWMHLLNEYIIRDAYAARQPPLVEPYADPKKALADGLVMLADGAKAIETFNRDVERGAIDIHLVTMMPGEPVDQVAERLQYLNDKVIPYVQKTDHPAASAGPAS
jgi:alkanesulfonate monooxygenase SsuD/methylene tetrahydromethanopterin reductase-like flavin-dependent oxidoreductase (luciferase family)